MQHHRFLVLVYAACMAGCYRLTGLCIEDPDCPMGRVCDVSGACISTSDLKDLGPTAQVTAGGATGLPFDPSRNDAAGVALAGAELVLNVGTMRRFLWVSNSAEGTVSKVDARSLAEVARYYTYPGGKADPSRTTVNLSGDVAVANRSSSDGKRASVVKIAGDESGCVDRNGNGKIDTARDRTPVPWPEGQPVSPDECVLWHQPLPADSLPRGAVFDATPPGKGGYLYIGLYVTKQVLRLDSDSGLILKTLDVAPSMPYGMVLDRNGNVWVRGAEGSLGRMEVGKGDAYTVYNGNKSPPCPYGIAADAQGRIYTAGGSCVSRFDPSTEVWETLQLAAQGASSLRGLAIDQSRGVWIADTSDGMYHVDGSGAVMVYKGAVKVPGGGNLGAAIDSDGDPWLISLSNSTVYQINRADYSTQAVSVGSGPYIYSDLTGFQLRNAGPPPAGVYRQVLTSPCAGGTRWRRLELAASEPEGTEVLVRVRAAALPEELVGRSFGALQRPPLDLQLEDPQAVLQAEVVLRSANLFTTPRLATLTAHYHCNN